MQSWFPQTTLFYYRRYASIDVTLAHYCSVYWWMVLFSCSSLLFPRITTRLTLERATPVYHLINSNVCMSGIHPFSLVRYSTMSCALHFTAALNISGVISTLSSNFRRFPSALPLEDDFPVSVLSTSILTRPRSLRWMAMIMGRLFFWAGVAP